MSLRRLILAVAALMALPTLALAQTSRIEGMALPGDYVKDYTGIYTYTSCVTGVGNLVYAELGNVFSTSGTLDRSVGAVLQNLFDGKLGTWGVHLREQTPQLGQGDNVSQPNLGNGIYGADPNSNTNESFDLMWGRKFGTTSLGLRLNRSFYQLKTEPTAGVETNLQFDPGASDEDLGRNITGFGGGLTFEMSANTKADFSLLYQSRTFEDLAGTAKTDDDGPSTYMLAGRVMYQWQPNLVLVPVFKYYSFDLSRKTTGPPAASADNSLKGWQAGMAGNWTVGNNDLFVLGVAFARNQLELNTPAPFAAPLFTVDDPNTPAVDAMDNGKATETIAPEVFAGLETHTNNWLTLRFGARKGAYRRLKVEPTAGGNSTETSSPFTMNIGAGVKLATLQLDAILNTFFPQTLGWLGSGIPGFYFPKVTATYAF